MSYNDIEDIMPISQYHNNLSKQVDDAEWMGEEERAYVLQCELDQVKRWGVHILLSEGQYK